MRYEAKRSVRHSTRVLRKRGGASRPDENLLPRTFGPPECAGKYNFTERERETQHARDTYISEYLDDSRGEKEIEAEGIEDIPSMKTSNPETFQSKSHRATIQIRDPEPPAIPISTAFPVFSPSLNIERDTLHTRARVYETQAAIPIRRTSCSRRLQRNERKNIRSTVEHSSARRK